MTVEAELANISAEVNRGFKSMTFVYAGALFRQLIAELYK